MDNQSASSDGGPQKHQKRVLPSRSRRGGPGVGTCDADIMILNAQKNKLDSEPLIPSQSRFLLSTNDEIGRHLDSTSVSGSLSFNTHATESYFDRPEVLRAYREQKIIETPEFVNIADEPSVGGRFRPRGVEDSATDTSDAAYEKRHRKYETFEKRQRLREKEKLKHEQYKLKERIEQLRAMDGGAFLTLPASNFSPMPGLSTETDDDDGHPFLTGPHVNGATAYNEGERRRKEMLSNALALEDRYRVLLPPDRNKKPAESARVSIEPIASSEEESESADESPVESKQVEKIKLKIPPRLAKSTSHSSTSAPKIVTASLTKTRRSSAVPPPPPPSANSPTRSRRRRPSQVAESVSVARSECASSATTILDPKASASTAPPFAPDYPSGPATPMSHPEIAVLETTASSPGALVLYTEDLNPNSISAPPIATAPQRSAGRPRKRAKTMQNKLALGRPTRVARLIAGPVTAPSVRELSPASVVQTPPPTDKPVPPIESMQSVFPLEEASESVSALGHCRSPTRRTTPAHAPPRQRDHVSYAGFAGEAERTTSLLVIAALRSSSSARSSRKAPRHLTAFGIKVPSFVDEMLEYELPYEVHGGKIWENDVGGPPNHEQYQVSNGLPEEVP